MGFTEVTPGRAGCSGSTAGDSQGGHSCAPPGGPCGRSRPLSCHPCTVPARARTWGPDAAPVPTAPAHRQHLPRPGGHAQPPVLQRPHQQLPALPAWPQDPGRHHHEERLRRPGRGGQPGDRSVRCGSSCSSPSARPRSRPGGAGLARPRFPAGTSAGRESSPPGGERVGLGPEQPLLPLPFAHVTLAVGAPQGTAA